MMPEDYVGPMGRDAENYLVWRNRDGMDVRVTECCQASAKGLEDSVGCRRCYRLVDPAIGGPPVPPYIGEGGHITSGTLLGWDLWPPGAGPAARYARPRRARLQRLLKPGHAREARRRQDAAAPRLVSRARGLSAPPRAAPL